MSSKNIRKYLHKEALLYCKSCDRLAPAIPYVDNSGPNSLVQKRPNVLYPVSVVTGSQIALAFALLGSTPRTKTNRHDRPTILVHSWCRFKSTLTQSIFAGCVGGSNPHITQDRKAVRRGWSRAPSR